MITSPCIGVCRIEPESGLCLGCARTVDEIGRWSAIGEAVRQHICATLHTRRLPLKTRCPEDDCPLVGFGAKPQS